MCKSAYESNLNIFLQTARKERTGQKRQWEILAQDDPLRDFMVPRSICYGTKISSYKVTDESISFIIDFYMFLIRICYDKDSDPDFIGIKCNNCDKVTD